MRKHERIADVINGEDQSAMASLQDCQLPD
jgi:hypothetical protein